MRKAQIGLISNNLPTSHGGEEGSGSSGKKKAQPLHGYYDLSGTKMYPKRPTQDAMHFSITPSAPAYIYTFL